MLEWVKRSQPSEVTAEFAQRFRRLAVGVNGTCAVALTGGESAGVFYDALAAAGVPENVSFYWSDERVVAHDSPDSNYRLAAERLLKPGKVAGERVHPVATELGSPACAVAYADEIRKRIGGGGQTTPRFPLIILGLGVDGHTGSLFPGRDPFASDGELVRAVEGTKDHPHPRITFTPKLINAADAVWFVVTGSQKDWAVQQLAERTAPVEKVPALVVDPKQTQVTIFRA